MSNKTQLQTNNVALDGYIARINAAKEVAASLPEAGSGGSGSGNIETCTITINVLAPAFGNETLWYVDSNSTCQEFSDLPDFGNTVSFTMMKNSLLCSNFYLGTSQNDATLITSNNIRVYFISGDVTFTFM